MRYLLPTIRPLAEDLAGTAAFYLLYIVTGSTPFAALVGLAIGFGQVARHRLRHEAVPPILAIGVLLTLVLGAIVDDPRFLLMKPSIVYACVAIPMLRRGWVIRYVPAIARDLIAPVTFDRVGWGWAALLLATAAANALLLATLPPRRAALAFAVGAALSKLILFAAQYSVLRARARRRWMAINAPSVDDARLSPASAHDGGSPRR